MKKINIKQKFEKFSDIYSPKIMAEFNDCQFKLARIKGEFNWHSHSDTDETFLVVEGEFDLHLRDQSIRLKEGEMIVVPKGIEHKPNAVNECKVMIIERSGTINTGAEENDRTVLAPDCI